jgi:hypothetical protein
MRVSVDYYDISIGKVIGVLPGGGHSRSDQGDTFGFAECRIGGRIVPDH